MSFEDARNIDRDLPSVSSPIEELALLINDESCMVFPFTTVLKCIRNGRKKASLVRVGKRITTWSDEKIIRLCRTYTNETKI